MGTLSCVTGGIAAFVPTMNNPWDKQKVMHVYRRLGFGADIDEINAALLKTPTQLVDDLIDEAVNMPLTEEPEWAYWTLNDYTDPQVEINEQRLAWTVQWVRDMITNGFRDKLSLFWHNHFVTQIETYQCPSYQYQYHKLLQQFALGNFKDFVKEMGKTPAMLYFLNGVQSTRIQPNENYARELYELFSLGADNGYTQQDIVETAKALTGFNGISNICGPIQFVPFLWDPGVKTIFGQTGNWNYDDVHDILFTQRADQVAAHICTKIYKNFVSQEEDETIIAEMVNTFKQNNWELAPVYRQLFKSEHFFDPAIVGTQIKNPIEYVLTYLKESESTVTDDYLTIAYAIADILGQTIFQPIDVAGWQGDRSWLGSSTLTGRWQTLDYYLGMTFQDFPEDFRTFAKKITSDSNDPAFITQVLLDHFLPSGLQTPEAYNAATEIFKWEVPQNYYDDGTWNLDWDSAPLQVALLLQHLGRIPEYQLY